MFFYDELLYRKSIAFSNDLVRTYIMLIRTVDVMEY